MKNFLPLMLFIASIFTMYAQNNLCDKDGSAIELPPHVPGELLVEFNPGIISTAWLTGEEPDKPEPTTTDGTGKPGGYTLPDGGIILGGSTTETEGETLQQGKNPLLITDMFANKMAYYYFNQQLPLGEFKRLMPNITPAHEYSTTRTGQQVKTPPVWNIFVFRLSEGMKNSQDLIETMCVFENSGYVRSVSPNILLKPEIKTPVLDNNDNEMVCHGCTDILDNATVATLGECDILFDDQLSLENCSDVPTSTSEGDKDIDVNQAWEYTTGSFSTRVGVIGSGVTAFDTDNPWMGHPDFQGEINGVEAYGVGPTFKVDGWHYIYGDDLPQEEGSGGWFHGTPLTAIIGARSANKQAVAGIAGGDVLGSSPNLGAQLVVLKLENMVELI